MQRPAHVRMCPAAIAAVDAFAAALRQQSYSAAFSRADALRIAAMEWRKHRQARGTPAPSQRAPALSPLWTNSPYGQKTRTWLDS